MDTSIDEFDKALMALSEDVASALQMEQMLSGKPSNSKTNNSTRARQQELNLMDAKPRRPVDILQDVLKVCIKKRKLENEQDKPAPSDEQLSFMARFTDKFKLVAYRNFLHFVPRLVNVVTVVTMHRAQLAEAIPVETSGVKLPLDLRLIASRCKNSYYAPKRFSAVQLAYSEPRCRVLVFRTSGPGAARVALLRAQRQLYKDAGIKIHVRNFAVINQVGAFSLRATLNCEEFANQHSATAHFDPHSFVGLAWRPAGECICCEVYGTGRANLPGSVVERELQESLSRMFPELLRFSSSSRLLPLVPDELRDAHRVDKASSSVVANAVNTNTVSDLGLWDEWMDNDNSTVLNTNTGEDDDEDDVDLSAMGF